MRKLEDYPSSKYYEIQVTVCMITTGVQNHSTDSGDHETGLIFVLVHKDSVFVVQQFCLGENIPFWRNVCKTQNVLKQSAERFLKSKIKQDVNKASGSL